MVVVDPILRRRVQRQLWWTGRLPESVQWIEAKAAVPVLQQLRLIADQAGSERLVIIAETRPIIQLAPEGEGVEKRKHRIALTTATNLWAFMRLPSK